MKLSGVIGFDKKTGDFVIGSKDLKGNDVQASTYNQVDVDSLLAQLGNGGPDSVEQHELLGQTIVEPIEQVVPYMEIYTPVFFQDVSYGQLEDNAIPVEDTVAMAWETHQDGAVHFVRSGFSWTRPSFQTWDTGIEVPWEMLKKAGWNFLARQMRRATEALARKRDAVAKNVLEAAMVSSHIYTVSGGALTRTSVDTVLKDQADIGFPVRRILCNPGTIMDMADFSWSTGFFLPAAEAKEIVTNLYIGNYGGADWFLNPFVSTSTVYFGGLPNQIGWHQIRGEVTNASDVDIRNKVDLHAIYDSENSWYVGNAYTLAKLSITA